MRSRLPELSREGANVSYKDAVAMFILIHPEELLAFSHFKSQDRVGKLSQVSEDAFELGYGGESRLNERLLHAACWGSDFGRISRALAVFGSSLDSVDAAQRSR